MIAARQFGCSITWERTYRTSTVLLYHLNVHRVRSTRIRYRGVDQKSVPAKPFGNVNNTVARVPGYRAKFGLAVRYPGNLFILATESTVESECEASNDEISP